jgi:hypothetical protein
MATLGAAAIISRSGGGSTKSSLWGIFCCEGKSTNLTIIVACGFLLGGAYFVWQDNVPVLGYVFILLGVLGLIPIFCCGSAAADEEKIAAMAAEQAATAAGVPLKRQSSLVGRLLINRMNSANRKVENSSGVTAKQPSFVSALFGR